MSPKGLPALIGIVIDLLSSLQDQIITRSTLGFDCEFATDVLRF